MKITLEYRGHTINLTHDYPGYWSYQDEEAEAEYFPDSPNPVVNGVVGSFRFSMMFQDAIDQIKEEVDWVEDK